MAKMSTDEIIRDCAKRIFARLGYEGLTMRSLAQESGVGLSSIYHFFSDKDILLKDIYTRTNRRLGIEREHLPPQPTAEKMLAQLIDFQFKHIEDIVFVLKYYLHFRQDFAKLPTKTLPPKSVLHIEEVLQKGRSTGEYAVSNDQIAAKARVISHTINGYLLEYFPQVPKGKERQEIINEIVMFSNASLA